MAKNLVSNKVAQFNGLIEVYQRPNIYRYSLILNDRLLSLLWNEIRNELQSVWRKLNFMLV